MNANQMAVEALKSAESEMRDWWYDHPARKRNRDAIAALEAEIAQEPVTWGLRRATDGLIMDVIGPEEHKVFEGRYKTPLYAAPQAVAVNAELLAALKNLLAVVNGEGGTTANAHDIARAAIANATGVKP